jgi:hypothetical protein
VGASGRKLQEDILVYLLAICNELCSQASLHWFSLESGSMNSSIIIETRFFQFTLHFFAITRLNPLLKAEDELITSNRYVSFGCGSPISIVR